MHGPRYIYIYVCVWVIQHMLGGYERVNVCVCVCVCVISCFIFLLAVLSLLLLLLLLLLLVVTAIVVGDVAVWCYH